MEPNERKRLSPVLPQLLNRTITVFPFLAAGLHFVLQGVDQ